MAKTPKSVEEFINRNKGGIVTAKRLGLGTIVGIQQAGLEEIDARNPNRLPNDFLAVQNIIPIIETAILIPLSLVPKSNTVRAVSADLLVGTTAMTAYRIAKMATPIISNRMRGRNAKSLMRGGTQHQKQQHDRSSDIAPMSLNLFTVQ